QELDPYYYTYVAQQVLTFGFNPINDQTSWYPEIEVSHRTIPEISYLESIWYSFYTNNGAYDNLMLALVASMYPPIAAAMAVFFIYLMLSRVGKKEWALVAAGLAAFAPVFLYKLAAGEQEVQPYGFFSLMFFYAMYVIALKKKDLRFAVLAGLAFAAIGLGSSTQPLALISVLLFMILQSLVLFFKEGGLADLKHFILTNAIILVIGSIIGSTILRSLFSDGVLGFSTTATLLVGLLFGVVLYIIKEKIPQRSDSYLALGIIILLGLGVYAFTPVGSYVKGVGQSSFGLAQYNQPLDRTIAEQGLAANVFDSEMGIIAEHPNDTISLIFAPINSIFSLASGILLPIEGILGSLLGIIFIPSYVIVNSLLSLFVGAVNFALGTSVTYATKDNSFLLFWILLFWISILYSIYQLFTKKEDNLFAFFLAIVMPPLVVGLLKAKYTIYATVLLTLAVGFTFSSLESIIQSLSTYFKVLSDEQNKTKVYKWLLAFGVFLVLLQFAFNGFAISLFWGSFQPLYQNDPMALQAKFQGFCQQTGDSEVCAAATDPLGYAANGTNYQYSSKLCALSLYSNYSYLQGNANPLQQQAVLFRCQRLSGYWIDS
ncbi:hypothetical protein HZC07_03670, partial [Candidatus Micrarchaeota archaeon]|nr:hypothetical protein [Candidatus Micrarchaeota archaeon]